MALTLRPLQERPTAARPVRVYEPEAIAAIAVECLRREVETWPKPGLVSHVDSGSHADMDAGTFRRSAIAIRPHLRALAEAGASGVAMGRLRIIGLEAEAAMLAATGGVNTHRGAIFGLGLLCAAAGAVSSGRGDSRMSLGAVVASLWGGDILDGPVLLRSHGSEVGRRYGAGGARLEAARGFPSLYEIALPALRRGAAMVADDSEAARVQACFALIAALQDTNLLHRGGPSGLRFAQLAARGFLAAGGVAQRDWREKAHALHKSFVARRLSPGGSADLLAMSLFVQTCETRSVPCPM
ncbi:putative 2-(5''-triphosphoribosyl)-3'-dephosphocoenzyme-A synthase [Hypericibacter terrae]|uniref:Probable 2-(5''-triphosphoribosyl)-3'-dephosphocoenzyme-A synthase n=1 Tax=Hypericibacter terrae TaxID=2602015 RepID=A0A5J6MEI0_9PROT|nr:triphosphoribosyl-dephospho-CoA synthase MdcB [Hypericibacter terrae]QEX15561.1 putative 2-(5''-triphosphoribosyl)-3'-dephosphocoenzyme-A synthase [Hypericibacter terrae]